jgi:hypothetical protein
MHEDRTLESIHVPLRLTYGLVPLLAGLDKFTNLLADWPAYISPIAAGALPVPASSFMHVVGLIEIAVGVMILTRWTRIGAYLAAAWLVAIAANLVLAGRFDIAVRDLVMAVGAWTLARVDEARQGQETPESLVARHVSPATA